VTLDRRLTYNYHIDEIICKTNRMFGFVPRQASEFSNIRAMMVLYSSFVCSVLEYGTVEFGLLIISLILTD
jgi:hypothetical protein